MDKKISKYLASGKFLVTVLFSLGKNARVQHGRISCLGTVLSAKHSKGKLRIVDHRGNYQFGSTQFQPVSPCPVDVGLSGQAPCQ